MRNEIVLAAATTLCRAAPTPPPANAAAAPVAVDPGTLLAEQRTFLAWIRTGLALTGFGFVVARFAIFLQQLAGGPGGAALHSSDVSAVLGVALVAGGVGVNLTAAWRHVRVVRTIARGDPLPVRPSRVAVAAALGLAVVGLVMAVYLARARGEAATVERKGASTMQPATNTGIVSRRSKRSVDETVARVQTLLAERGVTLFAVIDHSGEATTIGLTMRPTKLLIFGNPKVGTAVMNAAPTAAIDLPIKLLVWEDAAGQVWQSYNALDYLQARHDIPNHLLPPLAVAAALAEQAGD